jgi:hypothetical protein
MPTTTKALFELKARFHLNNGTPESFIEEDADGTTIPVYRIDLMLKPNVSAPTDPKIRQVSFLLDQSYFDPVRKVSKPTDGQFKEEITSFGDFTLVAKVQADGNTFAESAMLSDLLKKGHETDRTPAIDAALKQIQQN